IAQYRFAGTRNRIGTERPAPRERLRVVAKRSGMLAYRTNHHGKAAGPPIPELSARRRLSAFGVRRRRRGLDRSPCEISRRPFRAVFDAAAKSGAANRTPPV